MPSFGKLRVGGVLVPAVVGSFSLVLYAGQSRTATEGAAQTTGRSVAGPNVNNVARAIDEGAAQTTGRSVAGPNVNNVGRAIDEGVYTGQQAQRGQAIFKERCVSCHGETLGGDIGPPLTGSEFLKLWGDIALSELVNKIENTMPADQPGTTTRAQAADIVAYMLQVGKFPAGKAELVADEAVLAQIILPAGNAAAPKPVAAAATAAPASRPLGNLAQVMRGIFFPSSNLIFNVQGHDPGEPNKTVYEPGTTAFSWVDWGGGIYSGWELVDYAAIALADAAPLLLTPGRRCENGRPVPVERADWVKYTAELVEAGRAAYKASQSRNQEAVSEVTNRIAEACLNCHVMYRDKPGGTPADPSNKAARCLPRQP